MSLKITRDEGKFVIEAEGQDDVITTDNILDISPVIAHYFGTDKEHHDIFQRKGLCLACDVLFADPLSQELIKKAALRFCVSCGNVEVDEDDNTITFEKEDGLKITGRVCSKCYFELEEGKKDA